jgi:hypothetical protein
MKELKTTFLANCRTAKLKAKRRRAAGLALLAFLAVGSTLAGCGPYPQSSSPYSTDCLHVYNRSCGNPIQYDPIRDGHGG